MKVVLGTSDAVLDGIGRLIQADPDRWIGPRLAGLFFSWMFLGMLFMQASHYYHFYPRDPRWTKIQVSVVVILSILKTSQEVQLLWNKCITHFGDYRNAARVPFLSAAEPLTSHILGLSAMAFFIHRAWLLTDRNWLVAGLLVAIEIVIIALGILLTIHFYIDPYYSPDTKRIGFPMLGLAVAVDVLITGIVSYKLISSKRGFSKETDELINRLLRLSWECALPPALFAILNLIIYDLFHKSNMVYISFNMITPRLYVFSFMHTLNLRGRLRLMQDTSQSNEGVTWSEEQNQRRGVGLAVLGRNTKSTVNHSLSMRPNDELPIRIQTETVAHLSSADEAGRHIKSEIDHKSQALGLEDSWSLSSSEQVEKVNTRVNNNGRSVDFGVINPPK